MSEVKEVNGISWVPLDALKGGEEGVSFVGRLISLRRSKDRKGRDYCYGFLGDGKTSLPYVAWRNIPYSRGEIIEVKGAKVEERDEEIRLSIPSRAEIRRSEMVEIATPRIPDENKVTKLVDVKEGDGGLLLEVLVLDVHERIVKFRNGERDIMVGIIADETGKMPFTSWKSDGLTLGGRFFLKGVYIKNWKGKMEAIIDEATVIEPLSKGKAKIPRSYKRTIAAVKKGGAGLDVEVEGFISRVYSSSGFIISCPECERRLVNGKCPVHGKVKGFYNLRIWIQFTDNTGTLEILLPRLISQSLLNIETGELLKVMIERRGEEGREEVLKVLRKKLSSQPLRIVGDVKYREGKPVILIAKSAERISWVAVRDYLTTLEDFFKGVES